MHASPQRRRFRTAGRRTVMVTPSMNPYTGGSIPTAHRPRPPVPGLREAGKADACSLDPTQRLRRSAWPGHDEAVELAYFAAKRPTILPVWLFGDDEPRDMLKRVRRAVREWRDDDVWSRYRPDLVKMTPADGEASRYLLALVHDEQAAAAAWRALERTMPDKVAQVREINY